MGARQGKAAVMNLLSVCAAYGVLTAVMNQPLPARYGARQRPVSRLLQEERHGRRY